MSLTRVYFLLLLFAANFNFRPKLRRYLRTVNGPLNFTLCFRTESRSLEHYLRFHHGRVKVLHRIPRQIDATMIFKDESVLWDMLKAPAHEILTLLMRGSIRTQGNLNYLSLFNFLLSALLEKRQLRLLKAEEQKAPTTEAPVRSEPKKRYTPLRGTQTPGVRYLTDPYLGGYSLDDFPRLQTFLRQHFEVMPEICPERPLLLTEWYRKHGFETDVSGNPWNPVLRQAHAVQYLLENKQPRIHAGDLLAGTTTSKDVGVMLYPDAHGVLIWGELLTAPHRPLNPYRVAPETVTILHQNVFPFWVRRTFREWVRENHHEPLCQRIDDRFAVYFLWKTVAFSHTVADFPRLLAGGVTGLIAEINAEETRTAESDTEKRNTLQAMRLSLEGVMSYARRLSTQARHEADACPDPVRRAELQHMADVCARVPEQPAKTLHEALQAIWIGWIALHSENTNAGLSLGRMDQWLQPFFEADMALLTTAPEREAYVRKAIELVGSFYLRCTDHLPLVPDIGNYLFGGSSSDQAITLGGVTPGGANAVNDMTYLFLKVTEMLKIRDPNVNARFNSLQNDETYLRRLCEVNLVTTATPSIHGDESVMQSLAKHPYTLAEVRDWSAIGCVEPTISGKHMGHTGSMMFNMVAAFEMALNNGLHPLMNWQVGPPTGTPETDCFPTFEDFFAAYGDQLSFLVLQAVSYNNFLGEAHAFLRPTPLLSSLIEGSLFSGQDVTVGGAKYNTSGTACIGLADVVDSLLVVKQLVYRDQKVSFAELRSALADNFAGNPKLLAMIHAKVAKFGSGDAEALAMANRVSGLIHDLFAAKTNFRGGRYTTGFWSMSNHVAFGNLTGALPSGRLAGKAFTPGLTPSPQASRNLLDNLRDVALLTPAHMDNNMAFNVKYVPSPHETHAEAVEHMAGYARAYFGLGGMQMQLNVVSSAVLRDAMAHPENFQDLLVRISGYNAYFVTLNREMQIELIERAEFGG